MWKYVSANSTIVYIDVLDNLVEQYNNTRHSSIKMTPVEASKKTNEIQVWRNVHPDHVEIKTHNARLSVDDKVRITKKKKTFEKGYTPRWTGGLYHTGCTKHLASNVQDIRLERRRNTRHLLRTQVTKTKPRRV